MTRYSRGGWVDEPHTAKGYRSDYELLIVVNQDQLIDRAAYWYRAKKRLIREMTITGSLRTPVKFIVHTLQDVNDALARGRSRRTRDWSICPPSATARSRRADRSH